MNQRAPDAGICAIVYRSVARESLGAAELGQMLVQARESNRRHGITGLLVLDKGCFFQWFEGPPAAVNRLWEAIRADSRHHHVEVLGSTEMPGRMFSQWDMQLCQREGGDGELMEGSLAVPGLLLNAMQKQTAVAPGLWQRVGGLRDAWQDLQAPAPAGSAEVEIDGVDAGDAGDGAAFDDAALLLDDMVSRALSHDPHALIQLVAALQKSGMAFASIVVDLVEPAARRLGDLWQTDRCSGFDITVALGRMQSLSHQFEAGFDSDFNGGGTEPGPRQRQRPAVLIATAPGEPHLLALALSSEFFWRAGWEVRCASPGDDRALEQLVHVQHFDVLDLSLSGVFRREQQLPAMGASIRGARAASHNPALVVLASGRVFAEQPELSALVGADAACSTAAHAVSAAQRLMALQATPALSLAHSALRSVGERIAVKAFSHITRQAA